jgi:aminopeptidase N
MMKAIDHRNEHLCAAAAALSRVSSSENSHAGERSLNRNVKYLYTLLVPDRARTWCRVRPAQPESHLHPGLTVPPGWQAMANAPVRDSASSGAKQVRLLLRTASAPTCFPSRRAGSRG